MKNYKIIIAIFAGWFALTSSNLFGQLNDDGLINVSTRGNTGTGEDTLIAGFIVPKGAYKKILIKGLGPSLTDKGVKNALVDPKIALYHDGQLLAENDNWKADGGLLTLNFVPEFLKPSKDIEAGLIVFLYEGVYTVHLSASDGESTGIGLIEVLDLASFWEWYDFK